MTAKRMPDDRISTAGRAVAGSPSILFRCAEDRPPEQWTRTPEYFRDLHLDQIIAAVTSGHEEYDLGPFFCAPLRDIDAIMFRHEVMQDLEQASLFESIGTFARQMRSMRESLAREEKVRHGLQKQRWFFSAVHTYVDAITLLADHLNRQHFCSRGMRGFAAYLHEYRNSPGFDSLLLQTKKLAEDIDTIIYAVLIQGPRVDVRLFEGEPDYSAEVLAIFERFQQGAAETYTFEFSGAADVNHIEAQILDRVALLFPDIFKRLDEYVSNNKEFRDPMLVTFDREVQFYIAYIAYMERFRDAGLHFCYPTVTDARGEIFDYQGFDLSLAGNLLNRQAIPVFNDFHLKGVERIVVVSGPNQGGKTTFARTFGQLHYLASIGFPVPGSRARLFLFDRLFTHFERAENIANLRGKLQDDLVRIHRILEAATPHSIIVMNEIFTSTALRDALLLSRRVAARLIDLDLYCVWVTFIDELASLGDTTISMTSTVVPENPAERTYKIVRRPADGLAHAISVAEKYRLTYDLINERLDR